VAGIAATIFFGVYPKLNRKSRFVGLAFSFLLLVAAVVIATMPDGGNAQSPVVNQGPGSAFSYGQQGGITAGTINIGPTRRSLSDPRAASLKQQMLSELPRDKPITVEAILGNGESVEFAREIHAFLKQNSFAMKEPGGISQSVFSGSPKGVSLRNEANGELTIIVGEAE
jgi:hypothetical protein